MGLWQARLESPAEIVTALSLYSRERPQMTWWPDGLGLIRRRAMGTLLSVLLLLLLVPSID